MQAYGLAAAVGKQFAVCIAIPSLNIYIYIYQEIYQYGCRRSPRAHQVRIFSGSLRAGMAILAGLLAYCFNENKIFAVLKRQAYNYSIHLHIIHADGGWLGMLEQSRAGIGRPSPPCSKAT